MRLVYFISQASLAYPPQAKQLHGLSIQSNNNFFTVGTLYTHIRYLFSVTSSLFSTSHIHTHKFLICTSTYSHTRSYNQNYYWMYSMKNFVKQISHLMKQKQLVLTVVTASTRTAFEGWPRYWSMMCRTTRSNHGPAGDDRIYKCAIFILVE